MKKEKQNPADVPLYLFHQGHNNRAYEFFGAHLTEAGAVFRVWAPKAKAVSVVGEFNGWNAGADPMTPISDGVWEKEIAGIKQYDTYKYAVTGADGVLRMKADPYAFHSETRPANASKVFDLSGYQWTDGDYLKARDAGSVYRLITR